MTRFTSIHEDNRYEVLIRGIRSRSEAEAIVLAVEALPESGAWLVQPPFVGGLPPTGTLPDGTQYTLTTDADLPPHALSDSDDAAPEPMDRDEAVSR